MNPSHHSTVPPFQAHPSAREWEPQDAVRAEPLRCDAL